MIDCSKTESYFAEKRRMTKRAEKGLCKLSCSDCPLCNNNNGEGLSCATFEMYYPEKAISAIQRWSDEHPPKTSLTESQPRKSILVDEVDEQVIRYVTTYECPNCGKHLVGNGLLNYCYNCGQKLDWSDKMGGE